METKEELKEAAEALKEFEDAFLTTFSFLNKRYFNNELKELPFEPVTGQPYVMAFVTEQGKEWREACCFSICTGKSKGLKPESLLAALLHEMVHEFCFFRGIEDFNRETGEHLQGFIDAAAEHGLFYDDFLHANFLIEDVEEILRDGNS